MGFFDFLTGKKKQRVNLDADVISRPENGPKGSFLFNFKERGDEYGAPWYLPHQVKWAMMQDSQVFAAVTIWKMGVLVDGYQVTPCVDPADPRYKKAKEISDFCNWNLDAMQGSFHMKMLQMLDCCIWGHKAASQVYKEQSSGKWKNKVVLDYLRVVPNKDYKIRVNEFGRPVGLQSITESEDKNIIGMNKFLFCTFRPQDDNPWGTNLLWPVYDAWYQKQKIVPERLAHMAMFGSPSFWVESPEGIRDTDLLDANNKPVIDPATHAPYRIPINKAILTALENFKGNGSATALPYSSKLNMIQALGEGHVFRLYQDDANNEIVKGILLTSLMTEQSANQSRASSQTGQVTVQLTIADGKFMLADLVKEQLCGNLVKINFKEEDWDLVPNVHFGNNQSDITSLYNAISALWSVGFFDDGQRAALCQMLGLPQPDPNATRPQVNSAGGAVKNEEPNAPQQQGQPAQQPAQKNKEEKIPAKKQ